MGHQLLASTVFLETNTFTYCGCQDWLLQLETQCFIISMNLFGNFLQLQYY